MWFNIIVVNNNILDLLVSLKLFKTIDYGVLVSMNRESIFHDCENTPCVMAKRVHINFM